MGCKFSVAAPVKPDSVVLLSASSGKCRGFLFSETSYCLSSCCSISRCSPILPVLSNEIKTASSNPWSKIHFQLLLTDEVEIHSCLIFKHVHCFHILYSKVILFLAICSRLCWYFYEAAWVMITVRRILFLKACSILHLITFYRQDLFLGIMGRSYCQKNSLKQSWCPRASAWTLRLQPNEPKGRGKLRHQTLGNRWHHLQEATKKHPWMGKTERNGQRRIISALCHSRQAFHVYWNVVSS